MSELKMHWFLCLPLLLQWLALATGKTEEVSIKDTPTACEENWVFNDGFCYLFSESNDTMSSNRAAQHCLTYDAEHVTPKSEKELSFLQTQAQLRTTYGWSLNLKRLYGPTGKYMYTRPHNFMDENSNIFLKPNETNVPEIQKSFDKTNKCVAQHVSRRDRYYWGGSKGAKISTEPCSIELLVACQSEQSSFPKQAADYEKWFSYKDELFWLSGKRTNQAEADALCKKANMKLITSLSYFKQALNVSFDYTPWWTGYQIGQNGPVTDDGIEVDFSVVSWLNDDINKVAGSIVLLHSGNGRIHKMYGRLGLPYICKKRSSLKGLFGCPNLWVRAGRSCYSINKRTILQWSDAKKSCESRGSHLLTIDSLDEKLWLETVAVRYIGKMWTSGNDIAQEGVFTWHDGSTIDNKVLRWQKEPYSEYYSNRHRGCMSYYVRNRVSARECDHGISTTKPACQYELHDGETQCENGWKKLNDTCYGLFFNKRFITNKMNEIYCRTEFGNKFARPLIVKTKEVADFLKQAYPVNQYVTVWLGMKSTGSLSDWRWDDGTLVDFTVFDLRDQPDNGSYGTPENCMVVNNNLRALDENCERYYPFICEKDLSPVKPLGLESNSVSSLRIFIFVQVFFAIVSVIASYYW